MTRITLTLELTPKDFSVLCEVLPRLALEDDRTDTDRERPSIDAKSAVNSGDTSKASAEKKTSSTKPNTDKAKGAAPDTLAAKSEPETTGKTKAPNKTDVRAVALKLSKAGKQDELKEIFAKYGADKLSGVAESDYPALMKDLEAANAEG